MENLSLSLSLLLVFQFYGFKASQQSVSTIFTSLHRCKPKLRTITQEPAIGLKFRKGTCKARAHSLSCDYCKEHL